MSLVFRLRYQNPRRDPGDPETGYPGGEVIRDDNDESEFNEPVTRYFWRKDSLKKKVWRIHNPDPDTGFEDCPGRVVSIEVAEVSDWKPVDEGLLK